jgi:hypothetical protein
VLFLALSVLAVFLGLLLRSLCLVLELQRTQRSTATATVSSEGEARACKSSGG